MEEMRLIEEVRVKLVKGLPYFSEKQIRGPEDVLPIISDEFGDSDREHIIVVNLDNLNRPLNFHVANVGALNYCVTDMGSIFRAALLSNAVSIVVLHNHVSGILKPSKEDCELTERIKKAGEVIGINLADHLIFNANGEAYSIVAGRII